MLPQLVPIFYSADAVYAKDIVKACYEGGLRAVEFTNRGKEALSVFQELRTFVNKNYPDLLLGIGTIFTVEQAQSFIDIGVDFIVQPVTTAEVGEICKQNNVLWIPGAMTLNEIYQAHILGADVVKVFPANVVGSGFIKSIRPVLPHIKIMVTGGVEPTEKSISEWLGAGANHLGLGSQLFKDVDLEELPNKIKNLFNYL
jgi:2-dehydro-3-deoxyphosphogluconate aldolase / (4S)-4-hydroxy-2-oxoglutarate aldolase